MGVQFVVDRERCTSRPHRYLRHQISPANRFSFFYSSFWYEEEREKGEGRGERGEGRGERMREREAREAEGEDMKD